MAGQREPPGSCPQSGSVRVTRASSSRLPSKNPPTTSLLPDSYIPSSPPRNEGCLASQPLFPPGMPRTSCLWTILACTYQLCTRPTPVPCNSAPTGTDLTHKLTALTACTPHSAAIHPLLGEAYYLMPGLFISLTPRFLKTAGERALSTWVNFPDQLSF